MAIRPRLSLNAKLLRAARAAAAAADGEPMPDDQDQTGADNSDPDDDTTTTPPPASKKSKKAKKAGKARADDTDPDDPDKEDDGEGADNSDPEEDDDDPDKQDDGEGADNSDPDDDDDEDTTPPPASKKSKAKAMTGERARIAAITRSPLAAGREDLAEYLAFDTDLDSRTSLGILKNAPKAKASASLGSRMAGVPNPDIRSGGKSGAAKDDDVVAAVQAAMKTHGIA